jgi:hypothetical protein
LIDDIQQAEEIPRVMFGPDDRSENAQEVQRRARRDPRGRTPDAKCSSGDTYALPPGSQRPGVSSGIRREDNASARRCAECDTLRDSAPVSNAGFRFSGAKRGRAVSRPTRISDSCQAPQISTPGQSHGCGGVESTFRTQSSSWSLLAAGVNSTLVTGENLTVGSTVWLPAEGVAPGR